MKRVRAFFPVIAFVKFVQIFFLDPPLIHLHVCESIFV